MKVKLVTKTVGVKDKFKEVFPELDDLSSEELADRLIDLDFNFYTEEKAKVSPLIRLTLPLAFVSWTLMFFPYLLYLS